MVSEWTRVRNGDGNTFFNASRWQPHAPTPRGCLEAMESGWSGKGTEKPAPAWMTVTASLHPHLPQLLRTGRSLSETRRQKDSETDPDLPGPAVGGDYLWSNQPGSTPQHVLTHPRGHTHCPGTLAQVGTQPSVARHKGRLLRKCPCTWAHHLSRLWPFLHGHVAGVLSPQHQWQDNPVLGNSLESIRFFFVNQVGRAWLGSLFSFVHILTEDCV